MCLRLSAHHGQSLFKNNFEHLVIKIIIHFLHLFHVPYEFRYFTWFFRVYNEIFIGKKRFDDWFFSFFYHRPFSGCFNKCYDKGTYTCVVCDQELFSSETKYDSGCGWPAFNEVLDQGRVKLTKDVSHGEHFLSTFFF